MQDVYMKIMNNSAKYNNAQRKLPICFCVDVSGSMNRIIDDFDKVCDSGQIIYTDQEEGKGTATGTSRLDRVHEGFAAFYKEMKSDNVTLDSCEVAIVTFSDDTKVYEDFSPIEEKKVPNFVPYMGNHTYVTKAIEKSLELIEARQEYYRNNRISSYIPWLILFTDGKPTDDVTVIQEKLLKMQTGSPKRLRVFAMALDDAPEIIRSLQGFLPSQKHPTMCRNTAEIRKMFKQLSKSVSVSASGGVPMDF